MVTGDNNKEFINNNTFASSCYVNLHPHFGWGKSHMASLFLNPNPLSLAELKGV